MHTSNSYNNTVHKLGMNHITLLRGLESLVTLKLPLLLDISDPRFDHSLLDMLAVSSR